jgi:hypothetical protein
LEEQRNEGNGRILLGDNTGGGAGKLRLSGFTVFEFGFQPDSLVYNTHTAFCIRYTELKDIVSNFE